MILIYAYYPCRLDNALRVHSSFESSLIRCVYATAFYSKVVHLLTRIVRFTQMDFEEYAESEETPQAEIKAEKIDTAAPASVAVAA